MKKATLALSAVLALGIVSSGFSQDAQNGRQRGVRGDRPNAQQRGMRNGQGAREMPARPNLKPTLFANLGDECYTPDGMTISDETGALYLNVPNFGRMTDGVKADSAQGGYLYEVGKDGKATRILEYPCLEATGQAGPMGMDFGPDGNLYVCDNQYFHSKDYASRILRVVFENGKPTDKVEVVIQGIKLANGMAFYQDKMFYTDSCFDEENPDGIVGSGGVFMFTMDELSKAGANGAEPITIKAGKDEPHCVAYAQVQKLGREDGTGADGICVDKNGTVWFGNFGNGFLYCLRPNDAGEYKQENLETVFDALNQRPARGGEKFECCDGIFYDKNLDCIYIDDSVNNAIWVFKPCEAGQKVRPILMWTNDDNDGSEGLLDQPCEAVVFDGKLLIVNFDWPFPGMKNQKVDMPGTISAIDYAEVEKFVKMIGQFRGPRDGQGPRAQGQRQRDGQGPRAQGQRQRAQEGR